MNEDKQSLAPTTNRLSPTYKVFDNLLSKNCFLFYFLFMTILPKIIETAHAGLVLNSSLANNKLSEGIFDVEVNDLISQLKKAPLNACDTFIAYCENELDDLNQLINSDDFIIEHSKTRKYYGSNLPTDGVEETETDDYFDEVYAKIEVLEKITNFDFDL